MKNNSAKSKSISPDIKNERTVEVLCQKMGARWFAFSLIDDEVFVGSLSPEELESLEAPAPRRKTVSKANRLSGNS